MALLSVGCTVRYDIERQGNVALRLVENYDVEIQTKAESLEDASDDYLIKITNKENEVVIEGAYGDYKGLIRLPSEGYDLLAQNMVEEDALVDRGSLRLLGTSDFMVNPGDITNVKCTCTVQNARVSVEYDDSFKAMFKDVTVSVYENSNSERTLVYDVNSSHSSEESYGYFNIDNNPQIKVSVSATLHSGVVKTYSNYYEIAQGRWTKLTLASNYVGGETDLEIYVDTEVIPQEVELVVDPTMFLTISMSEQPENNSNVYAHYFIPVPLELANISYVENRNHIFSHLIYELSEDSGETWSSSNFKEVDGVKVFDGLRANTAYQFRVRYFNITSEVYEFTTEDDIQLNNGSFEALSSSKVYDAWAALGYDIITFVFEEWNTNNNVSVPSGISGNITFWTHDAVVKSVTGGVNGNYAVELSTRGFASKTPGAGEIGIIDRSDLSERIDKIIRGNLSTHVEIASRPSSVSFAYKYSSFNQDECHFTATLYDEDNNPIATAEYSSSESKGEYEIVVLDFVYTDNAAKAASLSIDVFSGKGATTSYVGQVNGGWNASPWSNDMFVGSVLTLDNVVLNYNNEY